MKTVVIATAPASLVAAAVAAVRARCGGSVLLYTRSGGAAHGAEQVLLATGDFGSEADRRKLRAERTTRAVLVYNNGWGIGYHAWREFARGCAPEAWAVTPEGEWRRIDVAGARAEAWRETVETVGQKWCRHVTLPLLLLARAAWRVFGYTVPPAAYLRALCAESGGIIAVSRAVRLLHLLRVMPAAAGEVLDIGTGDALLLRLCRRLGLAGRSTGVDRGFRPGVLRAAAGSELVAADLTRWQPARPYAVVVICEVLEHLADDAGCLRRWCTPLGRGTQVFIHAPWRDEVLLPGDVPPADHVRPGYTEAELRDLARQAGLTVTGVTRTFAPETARLCWCDRRLAAWSLLQHLLRPLLLALALSDPAGDTGNGLLLTCRRI